MTTTNYDPSTLEELRETVRATGDRAIATVGSGANLGLGNAAEREDIVLNTRGLNRIVDYVPEDQVVVVEAGITLGELQTELGKHGQRLAIESLGGDGCTIGGMLATNAYGASALRYGTLKDLIVGVELVRADGVVARAGGKVVKNVAGFDISKLIVGSLGTLAIITKATFRVHPVPESARRLAFRAKIDDVFPFVLALREAQLEPSSVAVRLDGAADAEATIEVLFEGFGPGVDAQSAACENIAKRMSLLPSEVRATNVAGGARSYRLKSTFPPSEFARVARAIGAEALAFPSLGVIYFDTGAPDETDAVRVSNLRELFESLGGTLVVQDMPEEWRGRIDAWGTPPPSFKLMHALKDRFDPRRRLNPGRFVGGL